MEPDFAREIGTRAMEKKPLQPLELFFCYSHEDEELRQSLQKHLRGLTRQGHIAIWHDRQISAGTEWKREIDKHLDTAQIILLLVSPDFMNSDYCYSVEMKRAMQRHQRGDAHVIPVILRPTLWKDAPFGKLQVLPTDAIPVVSGKWHNQDEAFEDVAEGIYQAVNSFLGLVSPDRPVPPSIRVNWPDQLTSSFEWQYLSRKAGDTLLRGWEQFPPLARTDLLQHWQSLSPQTRTRLLQDWQRQYQELEEETSSPDIDENTSQSQILLPSRLPQSLQPLTYPTNGWNTQNGQHTLTYYSTTSPPQLFTLLEIEQIMERVQKQTLSHKKLGWLYFLIYFVVITLTILVALILGLSSSSPAPCQIVVAFGIALAALTPWFIETRIVAPRTNRIVQSYTNDRIQTWEELQEAYKRLKKW